LYQKWVVTGVAFRVTFVNLSSTQAFKCIIWPSAFEQDPSTGTNVPEQQAGARSKVVNPLGSGGPAVFKGYLNMNKLIGTQVTSDDSYWGTGTTGPVSPFTSRLYVMTGDMKDASATANLNIEVRLTFYVKWWQRTLQADVTLDVGPEQNEQRVSERVMNCPSGGCVDDEKMEEL